MRIGLDRLSGTPMSTEHTFEPGRYESTLPNRVPSGMVTTKTLKVAGAISSSCNHLLNP